MEKNTNILKDAFILFLITFVLGLLLSLVNNITKQKIEYEKQLALYRGYQKVLGEFKEINDVTDKAKIIKNNTNAKLDFCGIASDDEKNVVGFVILTHMKGYGGDVKVLVGFDNDINIVGITYPENLEETPGIGMKVTNDDFINEFIQRSVDDIDDVPLISGATRSSTAVKESVKLACQIAKALKNIN